MKRMFQRGLSMGLMLALLLACLSLAAPLTRAAETYSLPVFETSDIHGFLVDSGYDDPAEYQYRMAYIADKVDDARQGDSRTTLLLDGGDIYQGNVVSNLQDGAPIMATFDAMEYDAVALGNHEFDWGIRNTTDTDGTIPAYRFGGEDYDSQIPILCSNIYYSGTSNRVDFTQDYVILPKLATSSSGETKEVNIAVIGYADGYESSIMSAEIAPYDIWYGLSGVESLAKRLKEQGLADAVILLAHADAEELTSRLNTGTYIDLVCGGHSHYGQVGSTGATDYIQSASQGSAYAYAELRFTGDSSVTVENSRHIWTTDNKSKLLDKPENADELAEDVMQISHLALEGVEAEINSTLGYIDTAITSYAISGNSMSTTGGNWMTDLANRATGSTVSFTNQGGIRTSFYISGTKRDITKGDIYTIAPFDNLLYVYDVTYAKLLEILNFAVGQGRALSMRMSGIDCYYQSGRVNALVLDGVCIYKDGKWKDGMSQQIIRISANEYIATGSGTPFYSLNSTDALINSSCVDNESFIRVLEKEGQENDGYLYVDRLPHLIEGYYSGELDLDQEYTITTSHSGEGTVTPGGTVRAGSDFTVEMQPREGHEITQILVDGAPITIIEAFTFVNVQKDHTLAVTFTPIETGGDEGGNEGNDEGGDEGGNEGGDVTPPPPCDGGEACPGNGFADMPAAAHWSHAGIDFALSQGLFNGMGDACFGPDLAMSRAMLVTVLWRYEGASTGHSHTFTDVSEGQWYTQAVAWAAEQGIVNGISESEFDPNGNITREQLATILYRYSQKEGLDTSQRAELSGFADEPQVSDWAQDAISWAVAQGLIAGTAAEDGVLCLDPQGQATRAQVAVILMRYIQGQ